MTEATEPAPGSRRDPNPTMAATERTGGPAGAAITAMSALGVLVLVGITAAGRADRAPPSSLILLVTLLPYLYGVAATWLFGLWTALPDRKLPPVLLTAVCVAALGLWGPSWASRPQAADGDAVTVMSWNLRRLWGGPDDAGDATKCAIDTIAAADPDVLALQEVSLDDVKKLEAGLGLTCVHATYRSGGGPTKGGLAACARGPEWSLRSGSGQRFVDPADWHYVFAELARGGRVFNLMNVHLHPYELAMNDWITVQRQGRQVMAAQSDQTAALLERMGRLEDPTVVAGDFNSTRDAALHAGMRRHLTDAWERGGLGFGGTVHLMGMAPLRVDYVYASADLAVSGARVDHAGCSDHRPVLADLILRSTEGD